MYGDPDDDLDAWVAAMDRALTEHFGPNHQEVLSGGLTIASLCARVPPPKPLAPP